MYIYKFNTFTSYVFYVAKLVSELDELSYMNNVLILPAT